MEALLKSGATIAVLPHLANPLLANRVRSAGIRTVILSEESPESPAEDIRILGEATGRLSECKKLLAERGTFKNKPCGKRVLIVWDGVCAGPLSYLSWTIRAAGAEPAPLQGAWPTWDIEDVVRSKPDAVIFLQTEGPAKLGLDKMNLEKWRNSPGLKSTPAAQTGTIFHLNPNSDWLPASGQPEVVKIIAGLIEK
jgi:ABC-type Fe3+-hydroxamate transport system substrate-binding protein